MTCAASLVGRPFVDFTTSAVLADGQIVDGLNFAETIKGRYAVLFFYPLDFTFVCPSELIALSNRMDAFRARDVEVFGVSVDSQFTHHAWRQTPVNKGGIGPVAFTLLADVSHGICQAYGVEHPEAHVALRGAFVIDKKGIVQAQQLNNLPIGRNIEEIIRLVDAVQFHEQYGEVCPAGWQKGEDGMRASPDGVASYLDAHAETL